MTRFPPADVACPVVLNRRDLMLGGAATIGASLSLPRMARADGCNAIDLMIAHAVSGELNASTWALTVSPAYVSELQIKMAELDNQYANAAGLADQTTFNAYLGLLNAVIAGGIFIAGATGAVAAAPLLVASVGFGGVMMIADGWTSPIAPSGLQIAGDVGLSRVGGLLSVAGDDAYAVSLNSAKYASKAGNILGFVGAALAAFQAGQKFGAAANRTAEESALREQLGDLQAELQSLQNAAYIEEVRRGCMQAVADDLAAARLQQTPGCTTPLD